MTQKLWNKLKYMYVYRDNQVSLKNHFEQYFKVVQANDRLLKSMMPTNNVMGRFPSTFIQKRSTQCINIFKYVLVIENNGKELKRQERRNIKLPCQFKQSFNTNKLAEELRLCYVNYAKLLSLDPQFNNLNSNHEPNCNGPGH